VKKMTTKQRAYLIKLSHELKAIFQVGKDGVTPSLVNSVSEALSKRELIKISVLKNCFEDPKDVAIMLSERSRSKLVTVIGRKIVLYKESKDKKIKLPK